MSSALVRCLIAGAFVLVGASCAEPEGSPPSQLPPGGGKADGTCTSTCEVACSNGTCAVATQVTSGSSHSCARLDDGSVWCWGADWEGQLGLGLSDYPGYWCSNGTETLPCRRTAHRVQGLPPVRQVVAGKRHTCALLEDDTVRCWGWNYAAQLGIGDRPSQKCEVANITNDCLRTPDGDPGLTDVAAIAPAEYHTCALTTAGQVWCWGTNGFGQLGSSRFASKVPVLVPSLSDVTAIASGSEHSCAVMSDTTVRCWGRGEYGQIGNGAQEYFNWEPTEVVGLTGVTQLALGDHFSCALLVDGSVQCWGGNHRGQLGIGSFAPSPLPVPVQDLANVDEIAAGRTYACARSGTEVRCWGLAGGGINGEILGFTGTHPCQGNPSYKCTPAPALVPSITDASQLALGTVHACALQTDGNASCWGDNLSGPLGDDSVHDRAEPAPVEWQ